jgi:hypothetical protein
MHGNVMELVEDGSLTAHDQVVAKELLRDLGEVIAK